MGEMIRFILVAVCMAIGLVFLGGSILGIFRFRYVLNRLHTAAVVDTMGLFFLVLGMLIAYGFCAAAFKLFLVMVLMWVESPIASHLVCKLEVMTANDLDEHLRRDDLTGQEG